MRKQIMNHKMKLLVSAVVIVISSLYIAPQVLAVLNSSNTTVTDPHTQMINPRPGPEADPTLRHCPGCYDYDAEVAPIDTLP